MGTIAYLPYLGPVRVQSETLQLTIPIKNAKLLKFIPHGPKALIGHRTYHNATDLAIKFRYRWDVRGGCVLIRPRLRTMASPPHRTFCPVHGFWSTNRGRPTPGGLLFPNTSASSFNQQLKWVTRDLHYDDGGSYPSHDFRRGGARTKSPIPDPHSQPYANRECGLPGDINVIYTYAPTRPSELRNAAPLRWALKVKTRTRIRPPPTTKRGTVPWERPDD